MKNKSWFLNIILLFISMFMFSQERSMERVEMGDFVDKEEVEFERAGIKRSFLLANRVEGSAPMLSQSGNQVFINQIGSSNEINSFISSANADVHLEQNGYKNYGELRISAKEVDYNLIQSGDYNSFFHFADGQSQPQQVIGAFHQNGNNNHVESYGSNSISNKLQFNIKGDSKSLIIKNYQ